MWSSTNAGYTIPRAWVGRWTAIVLLVIVLGTNSGARSSSAAEKAAIPAPQPRPSTNRVIAELTTATDRYMEARLTSATWQSVAITHAAGVARVPLADLTKEQILRLNNTSSEVQIPFGVSAEPRNRRRTAPELAAAGAAIALAPVARAINLPSPLVVGWFFFVVLPLVVTGLLCAIAFIKRKERQRKVDGWRSAA